MANYSTNNRLAGTQQNLTTTFKTLMALTAQTTGLRRFRIYELDFGADGTPADNALVLDVSRQTAAGTSTAATPNLLDPGDPAAATVGAVNFTAEGTITAASSLLSVELNQRTTYRWVAAPGSELVAPATNLAGFAIRALSPVYASTALATAMHSE